MAGSSEFYDFSKLPRTNSDLTTTEYANNTYHDPLRISEFNTDSGHVTFLEGRDGSNSLSMSWSYLLYTLFANPRILKGSRFPDSHDYCNSIGLEFESTHCQTQDSSVPRKRARDVRIRVFSS